MPMAQITELLICRIWRKARKFSSRGVSTFGLQVIHTSITKPNPVLKRNRRQWKGYRMIRNEFHTDWDYQTETTANLFRLTTKNS